MRLVIFVLLQRGFEMARAGKIEFSGDVMEKVAKTLSRNYGINLSFSGTRAYTDGKRIVIPAMPEHMSEEMVAKVRGYCDHEIGHVRFTGVGEIGLVSNPAVGTVLNLLEDFRI